MPKLDGIEEQIQKQRNNVQTTAVKKKAAKMLFFRGFGHQQICDELGLKLATLRRWIHIEKWVNEREHRDRDLIKEYLLTKQKKITDIMNVSLHIITKSLIAKAKDDNACTLQEAKLVADIFNSLDKIMRLDAGEVTERVEYSTVDLAEVRDALIKDKFIDLLPEVRDENDMGPSTYVAADADQDIGDPMLADDSTDSELEQIKKQAILDEIK